MIIEELGPAVANVWNLLRPATKTLVEKAWQSSSAGAPQQLPRPSQYDPRADQELNQLLAALDEHAQQIEANSGRESAREARRLADACATLLSQQTQSAEAFARLIERAHQRKNYAQRFARHRSCIMDLSVCIHVEAATPEVSYVRVGKT